ncbi:hypothetical protein BDV93DRAFT_520461 [Ceratobasidium sp. AG-I]|nr:hypothetical protein BDV93DRAFT_520461 [Ceratobasidium sp. AG-I]
MADFFTTTTTTVVDNACASGSKPVDENTIRVAADISNQQDTPKKDVTGGSNFSMCEIIM